MDFVLYLFHQIVWKLRLLFMGVPYKHIQPPRKQSSHPVPEKVIKKEKIERVEVLVYDQH